MVPFKPREYQSRCIRFLLEKGFAGLFLEPGLGKTSIVLGAFKILKQKKLAKAVLVIAPLRPCYFVWPAEAKKWEDFNDLTVTILHGPGKDRALDASKADIYVINPEGLPWLAAKLARLKTWPFDMLVVDECFPAGTMIKTLAGEVPIERLKVGDQVVTSSGSRQILKIASRAIDALIELKLSSGRILRCTPEHPIFTIRGWVLAKNITIEDELYDQNNLSNLQEAVRSQSTIDEPWQEEKMLLEILCSETDVESDEHQSSKKDGGRSQYEDAWKTQLEQRIALAEEVSTTSVQDRQGPKSDIHPPSGQWPWDDAPRKTADDGSPACICMELCNRIGREAAWLSNKLQSRLRECEEKVGDRSRRIESQQHRPSKERPKKGSSTKRIRVESITHLKLDRSKDVYNITIKGCPHFFANGVLVHNSTKFKRSTTQRFKLLRPMLQRFKRRYILTGTPVPNGLLDLFGQIYILDLGTALGAFITRYRNEYFYPGGYGGYEWLLQPNAEKRIYKRIDPLVVQLSAADHLKLPKLFTLPDLPAVEVVLPDKAMAQYRSMEKQFFIELGKDEEAWAVNSGVASMKCRQIANGGIYTDVWGKGGSLTDLRTPAWKKLHDAKTEAVMDLLEELSGKPTLIAYDFHHDRERLLKELGAKTPVLGSGVSMRASAGIIERWNRGEIPHLLVNPQSVAHGLNLQGGRAVIFHSLTWNFEDYEQLIRRVWRQGQEKAVYVYHVVAKGTIDEVIIDVLKGKGAVQTRLKAALRTYKSRK